MVCINYVVFLYLPTGIPRRLACSCSKRLLTVIPPSTRREVRGSSESWFMASRIYACVSECVYLFTARPLLQVATCMGRRKRGVGLKSSLCKYSYKTYLSRLEADSLKSCPAQMGLVGIVGQPYHQPVQ